MSWANVEAFKRIIDASNRREVEAILAELDPEFEYHAVLPILGGEAEYRGHEGMRAFLSEVWDVLDDTHFDFPDIRDAGDRLVAIGHFRARGKASGVATGTPFAHVGEFKDGKAVRLRGYLDAQEALEAAGLSECAMSETNVEIVRRGYEALNEGDLERIAADVAPDFEYIASGAIPGAQGAYHGFEDFKRFAEWMWSEFENPRWEVHELIEAGDQVLVSLTNRGRGKQSGAEVSWDVWQLWTFRDGKAVRGEGFTSRDEALDAAGLGAGRERD